MLSQLTFGGGQVSGLTADLWRGKGQADGLTPDMCVNPHLAQTTLMSLETDSSTKPGTREETLRSGNRQMSQLGWMATELG